MKNILLLGSQNNAWMRTFQEVMDYKSSNTFKYKRSSDIQTMWTSPETIDSYDYIEKCEYPPNTREYYDVLLYMISQADVIVANFDDLSEATEANLIMAYTLNLIQDYTKFKFILGFNKNNVVMDYLNKRHIFIQTFSCMDDVIDYITTLFYE